MLTPNALWPTIFILLAPLLVIFALYCGALLVHLFIRARRAGESRSAANDPPRRDGD